MNKNILSFLLITSFLLLLLPGDTFANNNNNLSEQKMDKILINSGYPRGQLSNLNFFEKRMIIENSGTNLKFDNLYTETYQQNSVTGKLTKINPNKVHKLDNIPTTTLKLTFQSFDMLVNKKYYKDIYLTYEWKSTPGNSFYGRYGISRDSIGIAVPKDWNIIAGQYSCGSQTKYNNKGSWYDSTSTWCPNTDTKRPTEINMYGASWQFKKDTIGNRGVKSVYKGTVKLRMQALKSKAQRRVVGKYAQSVPDVFGGYSVSVGWGPASITYTPTTGKTNQQPIDFNFK
ncbi:hypothetical protein WKH56_10645 [Priestia sp. SB1]|uniref:hypothetical protein n=1 Tax=Priestia sp. SB1 TaxID=3132359 RepID=UPI00318114F6